MQPKGTIIAKRSMRRTSRGVNNLAPGEGDISLPGVYGFVNVTLTGNARVKYIEPPRSDGQRISIFNKSPDNHKLTFYPGGNLRSARNRKIELYNDGEMVTLTWSAVTKDWTFIKAPAYLGGGSFAAADQASL